MVNATLEHEDSSRTSRLPRQGKMACVQEIFMYDTSGIGQVPLLLARMHSIQLI